MEQWYDLPRSRERYEFVDTYLASFTERDSSHATHIADSIAKPDIPLASTLVLIPVAAHQEAAQIENSLRLYAQQDTDDPFSVVLSLNSPTSERDNPAVTQTLDAVEACKRAYPHLDVRSALTFYDEPAIGTIRRDLWNGTLLQAHREGAYTPDNQPEYIGINHDIDTIAMSPRYIRHVQKAYQMTQRRHTLAGIAPVSLPVRSTLLKHAASPEHPNISRGIYWSDFTARHSGTAYEAGLVIPLSHYADRGGFPAERRTYETQSLWHDPPYHHQIPGTTMATSPRRYIERLRTGYHTIWTNDTFGANDTCRVATSHDDIDHPTLEAIIEEKQFDLTLALMAHHAINTVLVDNPPSMEDDNDEALALYVEANIAMNRSFTLAAHALHRIIKSPRLAQKAADMLSDDAAVAPILAQHFDIEIT